MGHLISINSSMAGKAEFHSPTDLALLTSVSSSFSLLHLDFGGGQGIQAIALPHNLGQFPLPSLCPPILFSALGKNGYCIKG